MKSKTGLYWSGKGRFYRRHKSDGDLFSCPKCKTDMVRRISDINEGVRQYVWVCAEPTCLYIVSHNKIASVDLKKVKDELGSRAKSTLIDDSILQVESPKRSIYVNSSGEIWTDENDFITTVKTPSVAVQEVRKLMASTRISFEIQAEDLLKHGDPVLAEPVIEDSPAEIILIQLGDEIVSDLMSEPEVDCLCPEDQDEVAVMVFDEMLADKKASYLSKMANLSAKILNKTFENMNFVAVGKKIKVSFDAKLASADLSKQDFTEFLLSSVVETDFYSKLSRLAEATREKTAQEIPDYSALRSLLLKEIKEQSA